MFVVPPGLDRSAPRDVELTTRGRVLAVLATLIIAGGIGAGIGLYVLSTRQAAASHALIERGLTTTGHVSRLWTNGDNRRRVAYRFVIDGREYTNRQRVSDARRRALAVGSPIEVRYLPSSPAVNDLGGPARSPLPVAVPIVAGTIVPLVGVSGLVAISRQRRLLSEGWATRAVITRVSTRSTSHGGTRRTVKYDFRLLSGAKASGRTDTRLKGLGVGDTVCIVYDPDVPARSSVYPFSLVRVGA